MPAAIGAFRTLSAIPAIELTPVISPPSTGRALPKPPAIPTGFQLSSKRGFIENDPLPDRPPEGEAAQSFNYLCVHLNNQLIASHCR